MPAPGIPSPGVTVRTLSNVRTSSSPMRGAYALPAALQQMPNGRASHVPAYKMHWAAGPCRVPHSGAVNNRRPGGTSRSNAAQPAAFIAKRAYPASSPARVPPHCRRYSRCVLTQAQQAGTSVTKGVAGNGMQNSPRKVTNPGGAGTSKAQGPVATRMQLGEQRYSRRSGNGRWGKPNTARLQRKRRAGVGNRMAVAAGRRKNTVRPPRPGPAKAIRRWNRNTWRQRQVSSGRSTHRAMLWVATRATIRYQAHSRECS